MIKVAIAEDIPQIAETLRRKLLLSENFEVGFVAANGKILIDHLRKQHNYDIVLMDIHMPDLNGIDATTVVVERWPQIKVVMSTVFDDDDHILRAIQAGACGYLMKDEPPAQLHRAIFEVLEGGSPMSSGIASRVLKLLRNHAPISASINTQENIDLTDREREVLVQLSRGLSYEQIADNLIISYGTVRKHVENIYRKLHASNRTEALNRAGRSGLL
jgi:DNA-binding NarL/FixJ family response regulator